MNIIDKLPPKPVKERRIPARVEEIIIPQSDIAKAVTELLGESEIRPPSRATTLLTPNTPINNDSLYNEDGGDSFTPSRHKPSTQHIISDGTNMLFQAIEAIPHMQGFGAKVQQMAPGSLKILTYELIEEEEYAQVLDEQPARNKLMGILALAMLTIYAENKHMAAVIAQIQAAALPALDNSSGHSTSREFVPAICPGFCTLIHTEIRECLSTELRVFHILDW